MFKNKKALGWITEEIMFMILNLIFLVVLTLFILMSGTGEKFYEEIYAKQIALLVDSAKPGTIIELNINELRKQAEKNKFEKEIVEIQKDKVIVKVHNNGGYMISHFNPSNIIYGVKDKNHEILTIKVEQN